MKTYFKTLGRMFKKHLARFLSIILIVLISVGFVSGLGSAKDAMSYSATEYYQAQNVSDFIIKSKSENGFTQNDIEKVENLFEGATVDVGSSLDLQIGDAQDKRSLRLYFLDFDNWNVNLPDIVDGKKASEKIQIYAEAADNVIKGYNVGDEIQLDFKQILVDLSEQNNTELPVAVLSMLDMLEPVTVTVCGIVQSPLTFSLGGEPSYNNAIDAMPSNASGIENMDLLENILYVSKDLIPTYKDVMPLIPDGMNKPFISDNDIYVAIKNREIFNALSSDYKEYIEQQKSIITEQLSDTQVLTVEDNFSFNSLIFYANKMEMIGYIVLAAFMLVTVLVVYSAMTRLLDEERSQIACLKTLGYSSASIVSKYLLFALIATAIGGVGAYFIGMGIMQLIYSVFAYSFVMPPFSSGIVIVFYIIAITLIVASAVLATGVTGGKMMNDKPANLLRPKPPKAGEKVILEKLPRLWKKLPFKLKSTFRNVLRYKSRFFMTIVSVAFSTALILAALALLDLCLTGVLDSAAIMGISILIVVFAGLLTAIVIYTLTNINISERNREIATLKVLGYHEKEVSGYIYREIYINSLIGIVFGYPISLFLMWLLFDIMGFGTIGGVSWYMWVITPFIVLAFTWLVTIILRKKIVKIDMNRSLKALE